MARLREFGRTRVVSSLGRCFLVLLAGRGQLSAQDGVSRLVPVSADNRCQAPSETTSSRRSFPIYQLLAEQSALIPGRHRARHTGCCRPMPAIRSRRSRVHISRCTTPHGSTRPKPKYRTRNSWSVTESSSRRSFQLRGWWRSRPTRSSGTTPITASGSITRAGSVPTRPTAARTRPPISPTTSSSPACSRTPIGCSATPSRRRSCWVLARRSPRGSRMR